MGIYLNPGNASFQSIRKGIYIDKSELISFVNAKLGTKEKLICVSRPRRFGKSFAAQMLCAYYDKSCDSRSLFLDLMIASDTDFSIYLNQFNVLYLDMTWFLVNSGDIKDTVRNLQQEIIKELKIYYSEYIALDVTTLPMVLSKINQATGEKSVLCVLPQALTLKKCRIGMTVIFWERIFIYTVPSPCLMPSDAGSSTIIGHRQKLPTALKSMPPLPGLLSLMSYNNCFLTEPFLPTLLHYPAFQGSFLRQPFVFCVFCFPCPVGFNKF